MDGEGIFLFKTSTARVSELNFATDNSKPEANVLSTGDSKQRMQQFLRRFRGFPQGKVVPVTAEQIMSEAQRFILPTLSDMHIFLKQAKTFTRTNRRHKRRTRSQRLKKQRK